MHFFKVRLLIMVVMVSSCLHPFITVAQNIVIRGYSKDALSEEKIPFASVNFVKSHTGMLSDSAGNFIFHFGAWHPDTLLVTYIGYRDYRIYISEDAINRTSNNQLDLVIGLERGKTVAEVVVKRKIDRGYLMWKRI